MKKCPNCGELVGDSITKCFNCFFDMSDPERNIIAEKNRIQREKELYEKKQKETAEQNRIANRIAEENRIKAIKEQKEKERIAEENRIKAEKEEKERIFSLNDLYEYDIVTIQDLHSGEADTSEMLLTINKYASQGWRLHTIFTNEIGKNSHTQIFGISQINSTIDQTILVFERKIPVIM